MADQHDEDVDPRAQWRHLPSEPTELIEETATETRSTEHGVPAVDHTEEFVRKYGL